MFVDRTGRRGRRVVGLGLFATLPALAFAGTFAISALNAPPVDRPQLPTERHQAQTVRNDVEHVATVGAREPSDKARHRRPSLSTAEVTPVVAPARGLPAGRR